MGDVTKDWMIRKKGKLHGPFTEYELRRKLVGSNIADWEVKQGESEWFPANVVLKKFKELTRAGIYLRHGDDEEGPYTAVRTLKILRDNDASGYEAKIGTVGVWIPGDKVLVTLERLVLAANGGSDPNADHPLHPFELTHTPLRTGATAEASLHHGTLHPIGNDSQTQDSATGTFHFARWDDDSDIEPRGYPRLPNQQRPIMYIMPGAIIAIWGIAAFAYTASSLFSGGPGIATVVAWFAADESLIGETPRVIYNVLFITLDAFMTLGSFSMILRRNLAFARASAILATIPVVGYVVMPFGIWACVSLFSREAERDFS